MKPFLAIIFCSFALFGQGKTAESDLDYTEDTLAKSIPQPVLTADTSIRPSPIVLGSGNKTATTEKINKIRFFGEVSGACVWHNYDQQLAFGEVSPRFGYGLSGGVTVNLKKPFRFSVGLRFTQTGNRVNVKDNFWSYDFDTITWEPVDSQYIVYHGFFSLTQYYLSIPISVDVFIKNTPIYFFSGVETGFLILASSYSEFFYNSDKYTESVKNLNNDFRPVNLSLNHGIGYQFKLLKKISSEVQIVFSWGLFPIDKPEIWGVNFSTREFSLRYRTMF
jgi:hypothetical protein